MVCTQRDSVPGKELWRRLEDSLYPSGHHDWEGKTDRSIPHDRRRQGQWTVGGRTRLSTRISLAVLSCETGRFGGYRLISPKLRRMST